MRFSVVSSGSKANCTFVEAASTRVLIDIGLSARETERRLLRLGIAPDSIDAILVTHEHHDHVYGIPVFSRKYSIPVFANKKTLRHLKRPHGTEFFKSNDPFWVGGIKVNPFSIPHDASDPVGFTLQAEGLKFGCATDLGRVTETVEQALFGCQALLLESNHDEELLKNCHYSYELKSRIASTHGHLSNTTSATFLERIRHSELVHVVLGHISENSNRPEIALETARKYADCSTIRTLICGSPYRETPLFEVDDLGLSRQAQHL